MKKKIIKIVLDAFIAALTALATCLTLDSCVTHLKASDIEYNGSIGRCDSIK